MVRVGVGAVTLPFSVLIYLQKLRPCSGKELNEIGPRVKGWGLGVKGWD